MPSMSISPPPPPPPTTYPRCSTYCLLFQPIEGAQFPESLKVLSFGARFDQPVEEAAWPKALEGLYFGDIDQVRILL